MRSFGASFNCITRPNDVVQHGVSISRSKNVKSGSNFEKYTDFWTSARMDETPFLWEVRGSGWDSAYFDTFVYLILYHPRVGVAVSYNSEFYHHIFRARTVLTFQIQCFPFPCFGIVQAAIYFAGPELEAHGVEFPMGKFVVENSTSFVSFFSSFLSFSFLLSF